METPPWSHTGSTSPMGSPSRITRLQEKEDLSHLNDRLANYIDTVRLRDAENDTLCIRESESEVSFNLNRMTANYEAEVADVRNSLDSERKERARLQLDLNEVQGELRDLKDSYEKKESDLKTHQVRLRDQEALLNTKTASLATVQGEKRAVEVENNDLRAQLAKLRGNLNDTKRQLQEEILRRTDICSRYESLKGELEFEKNRLTEELRESKRHYELCIIEISSSRQQEYDSRLAKALADMRLQQERQINNYKEDLEQTFNSKLESSRRDADAAKQQLHQMRMRLQDKCTQISQLQQQLAAARDKALEVEGKLTHVEDQMHERLEHKDREMGEIRRDQEKKLDEFQELMDVKVALDMEILAYKKMLEGEEDRLCLSPTRIIQSSSNRNSSGRASAKKRRLNETANDASSVVGGTVPCTSITQKATASGRVTVDEVDLEGKYVRLSNKADKDQLLGHWQVKRQFGSSAPIIYKFPPKFTLKAGKSVTIWAANVGGSHNPPTDLVWKTQNSWGSGDLFQTTLISTKGEEMAMRKVARALFQEEEEEEDEMAAHSTCVDREYTLRSHTVVCGSFGQPSDRTSSSELASSARSLSSSGGLPEGLVSQSFLLGNNQSRHGGPWLEKCSIM